MEFLITPITDFFDLSSTVVYLLTLAVSLVTCFFGQKLIRILVTWGGAAFGSVLFLMAQQVWLPDLAWPKWGVALLGAIVLGILCGFLYRAGLFCFFAMMGATLAHTIAPALQFDGYVAILFILVSAIILGILGTLLERIFVVCTTGIVGGSTAVYLLFVLVHVSIDPFPMFLVCALFSLFGIALQMRTTEPI